MQKLIDLNEGQNLDRGIFPSIGANQTEIWREAFNVEFPARAVEKTRGFNQLFATSTPVYSIAQAFAEGERRAYIAEQTAISMYQGGALLPLGSGFDAGGYWSLETWGTWLLATNGIDPMKVWKNTGTLVDLAGFTGVRADRRYDLFKKHKNHVLGYYAQTVEWSSESNPELWVPATNNSAGGMFIRDLDSDIVAVCQLGADMAIYSNDSMVLQRYIGSPFYFSFESAVDGIGAVSDSSVVSVSNKNFGLSLKGFFETDGIAFRYIDTPQINAWFKEHFYPLQGKRTVGFLDEETETIKWYFLGEGLQVYGVGYNYIRGTWTILDQEITAASEKRIFDTALIGTREGFGFMTGYNAHDEALETSRKSFPLDGGQREQRKLWDVMRTTFEGEGLEVRFGFSDYPEDEPEWSAWQDLAKENYIDRDSVFLSVHFRSTALGGKWKITGLTVHGEVTGYL